jgi:hypothetical protein
MTKKPAAKKEKKTAFKTVTAKLPVHSRITPQVIESLDDYLSATATKDFKRRLTYMFMHYLWFAHDELPGDFKDFVDELAVLMMFLDELEKCNYN